MPARPLPHDTPAARAARARWRGVLARVSRLSAMLLLATLGGCAMQHRATPPPDWSASGQIILVLIPDWNSSNATLRAFERSGKAWRLEGEPIPAVIGRSGAAWGLGLHPPQQGPVKREGDGRSPAGIFSIGTAFGYASSIATALAYDALGPGEYCVDVSGSPLYNRIVDSATAGAAAVAGSTEPMRRDIHANGDQAYKLGFVVEHNAGGLRDAGSCIFVHLWKSADSTTAGCTAMAEPALRRLLAWLQPQRHPLFVLLPQAEYRRLRTAWQLPEVAEQ